MYDQENTESLDVRTLRLRTLGWTTEGVNPTIATFRLWEPCFLCRQLTHPSDMHRLFPAMMRPVWRLCHPIIFSKIGRFHAPGESPPPHNPISTAWLGSPRS